jgi:hypothetical protein
MKKLTSDLITNKYTEVLHEEPEDMKYNAPHHFIVTPVVMTVGEECFKQHIDFQEGPIKECGVNGVCNEDLIAMVICRLEHFQKSEFNCRENALAITKLEESLMWLRKRTNGRENRGIEGTHTV